MAYTLDCSNVEGGPSGYSTNTILTRLLVPAYAECYQECDLLCDSGDEIVPDYLVELQGQSFPCGLVVPNLIGTLPNCQIKLLSNLFCCAVEPTALPTQSPSVAPVEAASEAPSAGSMMGGDDDDDEEEEASAAPTASMVGGDDDDDDDEEASAAPTASMMGGGDTAAPSTSPVEAPSTPAPTEGESSAASLSTLVGAMVTAVVGATAWW